MVSTRGRRARSRERAIAGPRQREKQDQIRAQNNVCAQDFMIIGRRRGRHGLEYSLHRGLGVCASAQSSGFVHCRRL